MVEHCGRWPPSHARAVIVAGDRIEIGGQSGIVRTVEPLLRDHGVRLVVQLLADQGH
jgi:hypothetical protein